MNFRLTSIMRSVKMKYFFTPFALLIVYLVFFYVFIEKSFNYYKTPVKYSSVVLSYVVVHMDLKGSPPKLSYLESLLPKFKNLGVNALLMEYEDMFPYEGRLVNLSSTHCYNRNELKKFISKSVNMGIEIIPLIQTLGHMEHVLKLQEFKRLREVPLYPDSICPTKQESKDLLKDMLDQVIHFHNSIEPLKHIHVGCDEVYHINKCEDCLQESSVNLKIFTKHINYIDSIVRKFSPDTKVLIWDDMLREERWIGTEFDNIEPVYWDYTPKLNRVTHTNIYFYRRHFKDIWIATAFKGADGITAEIPHIPNRFNNHLRWMDLIMDYKFGGESKVYDFKGIILTGWSRYSHMDPLCELLPVAIPSLYLNLLLIRKMKAGVPRGDISFMDPDEFFEKYLLRNFNANFRCKELRYIDEFDNTACLYTGCELYNVLIEFSNIQEDVISHFDTTILDGIEYYYKIDRLNINNVKSMMPWVKGTLKKLKTCQKKLRRYMSEYYEEFVIEEYVKYKTHKTERKLTKAMKMMKSYFVSRSWRRDGITNNVSVT